jgi:hypothetical protein
MGSVFLTGAFMREEHPSTLLQGQHPSHDTSDSNPMVHSSVTHLKAKSPSVIGGMSDLKGHPVQPERNSSSRLRDPELATLGLWQAAT